MLFILLTSFQESEASLYKPFNFHNTGLLNRNDSFQPKKHSPHKATIYSAILPGLGQAYNRKYWKIPIVYAGLGTSTYFLLTNRDEMRQRQNALIALKDNDPNTVVDPKFENIPEEILVSDRNYYRTNRDYSIIATAALYLLNLVDAAVDAHFYKFDIDRPLASNRVQIKPELTARQGYAGIGLSLTF